MIHRIPNFAIWLRSLAACGAVFLFSACASEWTTLRQSAQYLVDRRSHSAVDSADLPPGGYFLRVISGGNTAILALERIEPHPYGRILVWTSGLGEVIKVQEGRIFSATGLRTEWMRVGLPHMPDWPVIAAMPKPFQWERSRDVRPGYRFDIRDQLVVRAIPPPERSELRVLDPKSLTWFEERFAAGSPSEYVLPPARYAVFMKTETVVYGEQCLARDLCLVWQRWNSDLQQQNKQQMTRAAVR